MTDCTVSGSGADASSVPAWATSRASSQANSGLPPARSTTDRRRSPWSVAASPPTSSAHAPSVSSVRARRSTSRQPSMRSRTSGRAVATTSSGWATDASASPPTKAISSPSAQCRSSNSTTAGDSRARSPRQRAHALSSSSLDMRVASSRPRSWARPSRSQPRSLTSGGTAASSLPSPRRVDPRRRRRRWPARARRAPMPASGCPRRSDRRATRPRPRRPGGAAARRGGGSCRSLARP